MQSAQRAADRKSVGPILGLVLFVILGGSILFTSWRFLKESAEDSGGDAVVVQSARKADPVQPERLLGGPIRTEDLVQDTTVDKTELESGSAPALLTQRVDAIAKAGRGLDPDTPTFNVVGKVSDAETGDAVVFFEVFTPQRADGPPLEAIESGRSQKFRSSGGEFTLRYLPAGDYNLVVRSTTHQDQVLSGGLTVPHEGTLAIALDRGTWISGVVRDNFGKPLENKEVHITPKALDPGHRPPRRRIVRTSDVGYFEFTQLPPGRYSMFVGSIADPDASHEEFYLGQDEHLDRSFAVNRQTTLKFILKNEFDNPIPRARVTLVSREKRGAARAAYSNIQGEARLLFVKPGEYGLVIKASGYDALEEETYFVRGGDLLVEVPRTLSLTPKDSNR